MASVSSQLPTVREKNLQRTISEDNSPSLIPLTSEETVVSSQKVNTLDAKNRLLSDPSADTGFNKL